MAQLYGVYTVRKIGCAALSYELNNIVMLTNDNIKSIVKNSALYFVNFTRKM